MLAGLADRRSSLISLRGRARSTPSTASCAASPGLRALLAAPTSLIAGSTAMCAGARRRDRDARARLDEPGLAVDRPRSKDANAAADPAQGRGVGRAGSDRLRTARAVGELAGRDAGDAAIEAMAVGAAGAVGARPARGAGPRLGRPAPAGVGPRARSRRAVRCARWSRQRHDPLFGSPARCARTAASLSFVYKAAAEIGELGDNTRVLRRGDHERRAAAARAVVLERAKATVLGHTRWATRRHHRAAQRASAEQRRGGPDRRPHAVRGRGAQRRRRQLRRPQGRRRPAHPGRDHHRRQGDPDDGRSARSAEGLEPGEAFRRVVASFEGSVAIAAGDRRRRPSTVLLALRGSGQALYVGLAEDAFIVASEPYGARRGDRGLPAARRRDAGRSRRTPTPAAVRSSCSTATAPARSTGITRLSYDGTVLPVTRTTSQTAQITTRDIDRGAYPHFLLKEIIEAPGVVPQDAAGQARRAADGHAASRHSARTPSRPTCAERLRSGAIERVIVIGQGTAAVAGQSLALALSSLDRRADLRVDAMPATELSGFGMRPDMSDTLVVAISQSGTTTDTNRTVDLARARGASVIAIVNRRHSDLTDQADGVLYTSDGRDVEMSVASTKAFYAQVAAGFLLACGHRRCRRAPDREARSELLRGLRELPDGDGAGARRPRGRSPRPPSGSHPPGATGRSSATGSTASRPRRCASSSPSSATSRSPATRPRTRSTSTCPPSRSSSCAPPA